MKLFIGIYYIPNYLNSDSSKLNSMISKEEIWQITCMNWLMSLPSEIIAVSVIFF